MDFTKLELTESMSDKSDFQKIGGNWGIDNISNWKTTLIGFFWEDGSTLENGFITFSRQQLSRDIMSLFTEKPFEQRSCGNTHSKDLWLWEMRCNC